jgi:hypothetical protein
MAPEVQEFTHTTACAPVHARTSASSACTLGPEVSQPVSDKTVEHFSDYIFVYQRLRKRDFIHQIYD